MKKLIFILIACCTLISCTGNQRAKHLGGNYTINLPAGQKLIHATWKDNSLWYLTEPMEESYLPTTKILHEDSNYGCLEGSVTFVETK